jgi:hypothetical protein
MTDIIARAEATMTYPVPGSAAELVLERLAIIRELVKELKNLRAQSIFEQHGKPGDTYECPTCSAEWVAEGAGALDIYWRLRGDIE